MCNRECCCSRDAEQGGRSALQGARKAYNDRVDPVKLLEKLHKKEVISASVPTNNIICESQTHKSVHNSSGRPALIKQEAGCRWGIRTARSWERLEVKGCTLSILTINIQAMKSWGLYFLLHRLAANKEELVQWH